MFHLLLLNYVRDALDLCLGHGSVRLHGSSCSCCLCPTTTTSYNYWRLRRRRWRCRCDMTVRLLDRAYRSVGGSLRWQQRWNRLRWCRTEGGVTTGVRVGDIFGTSLSIHHACKPPFRLEIERERQRDLNRLLEWALQTDSKSMVSWCQYISVIPIGLRRRSDACR